MSKLIIVGIYSKVVSLFIKDRTNSEIPTKIDDFKLVSKLDKIWEGDSNILAIYENSEGKKGFAKIWLGNYKNTKYYYLKNEIDIYKSVNELLSKIELPDTLKGVKFPKLLTYSESKNSLVLLIEYIDGKSLKDFSNKEIINTYEKIQNFFNYITKYLKNDQSSKISQRTSLDYVLLLPVITIVALIRNFDVADLILKGTFWYVKNLVFFLKQKETSFSHRDLNLKNILVNGSDIYVIDLESSAFTFQVFDYIRTMQGMGDNILLRKELINLVKEKYKNNKEAYRLYNILSIDNCIHRLTANDFDEQSIVETKKLLESLITEKNESKVKSVFFIRKTLFNLLYKIFYPINKNKLSVLCYHGISNDKNRYSINIENFKEQLNKISLTSKFVDINNTLKVLNNKRPTESEVLLTFDDGFQNIKEIIPFLEEKNIPAVFFVLASPESADRKEIDSNSQLLTVQEIKELHDKGFIIGCHSYSHKNFSSLTDTELEKEVIESKLKLEKDLGFEIKYFAYPKGFYNEDIIKAVQKAGYETAFSIDPGCITLNSNRWILPRSIIDNTHALDEFPALYCYSVNLFKKAVNRFKIWERFLK